MKVKTFYLLSAIPGSGKSTWANLYKQSHKNVFIVSSDELRLELFGGVQNFSNEKLVWDTFLKRINDYALNNKDCTVIADATNLENKFRMFYFDNTPIFDKHILVLFPLPFKQCLKQNEERDQNRIVPLDVMKRLNSQFEDPSEEVISSYDEIIKVDRDFINK